VQWLSSNRISLSGSIDPSAAEYVTVEIPTGKEIDDYVDQGMGAAYSPDGESIAYVEGSPHFTPVSERVPNLQVNGRRIYPKEGLHVVFLSKPAWSPDGLNLAIVGEGYLSPDRSLVECTLAMACSKFPLPAQFVSDSYKTSWSDEGITLSAGAQSWAQHSLSAALVPEMHDPFVRREALEKELKAQIQEGGGKDTDVWCQNCALARYPRRTREP
jgi:hypothetical protein